MGITDQSEKHLASEGTGKLGLRLRESGVAGVDESVDNKEAVSSLPVDD
jgi:hypothetical protein